MIPAMLASSNHYSSFSKWVALSLSPSPQATPAISLRNHPTFINAPVGLKLQASLTPPQRNWKFRSPAVWPMGGGFPGAAVVGLSAVAIFLVSAALPASVLLMASASDQPGSADEQEQPQDFRYYQIYASESGTTHFTECLMHGFDLQSYSSKPQFVRSDFGGEPIKLVFTQLAPGLEQPLHSCPQVQFVVTLSGSWYVKTSDGSRHEFKAGDVLFQDNTKNSPADNQPQHYSGVVGNKPCQQMIVQLSRPPQVNNPNPF